MTITLQTFKATDSLYSNPVGLEETCDIYTLYSEPVLYNSEMEKIDNRLQQFLRLENNWDGYSAVVPKHETISNVLKVLENLKDKYIKLLDINDVVPSSYGTVSLYFEDNDENELSVEFGTNSIGICGEIDGDQIIIDDLPMYDFNIAIDNINRLKVLK